MRRACVLAERDGGFSVACGPGITTAQVRFVARVVALGLVGTSFATVTVPGEALETPACGGFVFEQPATRRGIRDFATSSPLTISTLVWAPGLKGTVAPLNFALGSRGGESQRRWPVQLGIPLANGLWRVAFTLRPPFPAGNMEVRPTLRPVRIAEGTPRRTGESNPLPLHFHEPQRTDRCDGRTMRRKTSGFLPAREDRAVSLVALGSQRSQGSILLLSAHRAHIAKTAFDESRRPMLE